MDVNKQFTALQNNIWDVFCDGEHRLIDKQHNITLKIEEDISYIEIMGHVKVIRSHIENLEAVKAELLEACQTMVLTWERQDLMIVSSVEKAIAALAKADGKD